MADRSPSADDARRAPYEPDGIHYSDRCGAFRIVLERGKWGRWLRQPWRWRVEGLGWTPRPNPISDRYGWSWRAVLHYRGQGVNRRAVPCSGKAASWVNGHKAAMTYLDALAPELRYALDRNVRTITRDALIP